MFPWLAVRPRSFHFPWPESATLGFATEGDRLLFSGLARPSHGLVAVRYRWAARSPASWLAVACTNRPVRSSPLAAAGAEVQLGVDPGRSPRSAGTRRYWLERRRPTARSVPTPPGGSSRESPEPHPQHDLGRAAGQHRRPVQLDGNVVRHDLEKERLGGEVQKPSVNSANGPGRVLRHAHAPSPPFAGEWADRRA